MKQKNRGFTLIELMVVMGIIGMLLVLLLPALGGTRERAKGMDCANNLRQHGMAIEMYADEHDGTIPRVTQLGNYLDNPDVFVCLKDKRDEAIFAEVEIFPVEERFKHSYTPHKYTPTSNRASDVNGASTDLILLVESDQAGIEPPEQITVEDLAIRHEPFTYVLHVDGHVQGYADPGVIGLFMGVPFDPDEIPADGD